MIYTVLCGRLYKIFDSPMLHKNPSQSSLRGFFVYSAQIMRYN